MKKLFSHIPVLLLFLLWSVTSGHSQDLKLGEVHINVTADPVAQPYFMNGLLLLHNFEYEDAAREFEMAQLLDPNLVMAYWGEAMCYHQPLWFYEDFAKGKGALFKLGVKKEERLEKAKTALEKDFISAMEVLYGDEKDKEARYDKYREAMANMYNKYPAEEEVAAFYALALIRDCKVNDKTGQCDAAAKILMKIHAKNPTHPGAMNYLIQIYDDPITAYKARKVANSFMKLAPESKFGLHIPSHTFLALGDWQKVTQCNEAAWKAAEAWVKKRKKSLEDRDYHARWWLQYAYLQEGKFSEALELLNEMNRDARYSKSERMRFHLAMMRGHYLAETGKWLSDVVKIEIPTKGFSVSVKNMCFFVDAMAALEKHDLPRVDWYLNQMTDQRTVEQNNRNDYTNFRLCSTRPVIMKKSIDRELALAEAMEWELQALKALKLNKLEESEGFIRKAIILEDGTAYDPGPPVVLRPSHEIYGEILSAMGKSREAIQQFDLALQRAPGRSLSLLGKYKALMNLGEKEKAALVKKLLMKNWQQADPQALSLLDN